VADRVVGSGTNAVELPFASGIRRVPSGPASIAYSTGAAIIIAHIVQSKGEQARYTVQFDAPIYADRSRAREANEMELTRRITDRLVSFIAAHPDEWYVFQPEWLGTRG